LQIFISFKDISYSTNLSRYWCLWVCNLLLMFECIRVGATILKASFQIFTVFFTVKTWLTRPWIFCSVFLEGLLLCQTRGSCTTLPTKCWGYQVSGNNIIEWQWWIGTKISYTNWFNKLINVLKHNIWEVHVTFNGWILTMLELINKIRDSKTIHT